MQEQPNVKYNVSQNKTGGNKYKIVIEIESGLSDSLIHEHFKQQLVYLRRIEAISAIKSLTTEANSETA